MHNLDGVVPLTECTEAGLNLLRYSNGEPYDKPAIQNALGILERCRKVLFMDKSLTVEDESVLLDMLIDYATTHTDRDIKDEVADVYAIVRDVVDGKSVDASAAETFFSRMTSIGINRVVYQKIGIAHGPRICPH